MDRKIERQVKMGVFIHEDIPTMEDAKIEVEKHRINDLRRSSYGWAGAQAYTYEITGVAGNYKIIRRDSIPSSSPYVN